MTVGQATKADIVEVIAESDLLILQLISSRFAKSLQQLQGKKVRYSLNCATCAWY